MLTLFTSFDISLFFWETYTRAGGKVYYWCADTDEVLWEPPPDARPRTAAERDTAAEAAGSMAGSVPTDSGTEPLSEHAAARHGVAAEAAADAPSQPVPAEQLGKPAAKQPVSPPLSPAEGSGTEISATEILRAQRMAEELSAQLRSAAGAVFAGASKLVWLAVEAEVRARDLAALGAAHGPPYEGNGSGTEARAGQAAHELNSARDSASGSAAGSGAKRSPAASTVVIGHTERPQVAEAATAKAPLTWAAFEAYSLAQLSSIAQEAPAALQEADMLRRASAAAAANAASAMQQHEEQQQTVDECLADATNPPLGRAAAEDSDVAMEDGELDQNATGERATHATAVPSPSLHGDGALAPHARRADGAESMASTAKPSAIPSAAPSAELSAGAASSVPAIGVTATSAAAAEAEATAPPPPPPSDVTLPCADPHAAAITTGFAAGRPARLDPLGGAPVAGPGLMPGMPMWPPPMGFPPFMPPYPFPAAAPWPPMFFLPPAGGYPGFPVGGAVPAVEQAPAPVPAEEPPPPLPDESEEAPLPPTDAGATFTCSQSRMTPGLMKRPRHLHLDVTLKI